MRQIVTTGVAIAALPPGVHPFQRTLENVSVVEDRVVQPVAESEGGEGDWEEEA